MGPYMYIHVPSNMCMLYIFELCVFVTLIDKKQTKEQRQKNET